MLKLFKPIIKSINGREITIDQDKLKAIKPHPAPYTRPLEIQLLAWILEHVKGDYLEIGVNIGGTAESICQYNPDRIIYGVDYIDGQTMHDLQLPERPTKNNVGIRCQYEPNFILMLGNSHNIKIPEGVGMVFIDGDHSYDGVKYDTLNTLRQVRSGTMIFWHDYGNNLHPEYMGVKDYLDNEINTRMKLWTFKDTWLIAGKTS